MPEGDEPPAAIFIRRARESDRARFDYHRGRTIANDCRRLTPDDADHRRSRGGVHRTRYVAITYVTTSRTQPSAGRPRHLPHADAAPAHARSSAHTARTHAGAHGADQTENA